jgi:ribosomal protein L30E
MDKRKIAIVYDSSYLMGDFQSIKSFIMSRRFSSLEKQGLLGFMKAKQTVYHEPAKLFFVTEVVPNEVISELDEQTAIGPQKTVVDLLQGGAVRVDLAMDTVVAATAPIETHKKISLYAERLVSYATREQYDLAIIGTERDELVEQLAALAARGKAVFGVKSEHLVRTRLLHDKLADVANEGRTNLVVMEN